MNKTATITAKISLINAKRYANEKNKEYSRLRISKNALRLLSGRKLIRDSFIDELTEEFYRIGWHFFVHSDTEYGIIKADKVNVWAKISATRVRDLIEANEDDVEAEFERLFGINEESSLSEEE